MKEQWIIGVCNTDCDGVDLIGFYGTEDEVKAKLVEMVQSDRLEDDGYEYGTESVGEVDDRYYGAELYAYGCYYDYHIDYSAKRLKDIL
jgi:hypothetical protein